MKSVISWKPYDLVIQSALRAWDKVASNIMKAKISEVETSEYLWSC